MNQAFLLLSMLPLYIAVLALASGGDVRVTSTNGFVRGDSLSVAGNWCPNCEAPFLEMLYLEYHSRGLEIVALDFEEQEQMKDPERLRTFINRNGIQYTYLIRGEPSEFQSKIPQAKNLNAWATTFFVGRDGKVRPVYAGFAAPASGEFNVALEKEVSERIELLLAENVRTSR